MSLDGEHQGEIPNFRAERFALLTGPHTCYRCGAATRVSCIGLSDYEELGEDGFERIEDSVLFTQLSEINPEAEAAVARLAPWLRFDTSRTTRASYLANHCEVCGTLIGAWFISEPGEAFFPETEEEVRRLTVNWIEQPISFVDLGGMQSRWIDRFLVPGRQPKKMQPVTKKR